MPDDDPPFDLAGCLDRVRRRDQAAARALVEHLHPLVSRIVRSHLPRRVAEEEQIGGLDHGASPEDVCAMMREFTRDEVANWALVEDYSQ